MTFNSLVFVIITIIFSSAQAQTKEGRCSTYSALENSQAAEGLCVGVVLTKKDVPFNKPRKLFFKDDDHIIVSDMGDWESKDAGVVWEISLKDKSYKKVYENGFWTHGLGYDSQERLLIGDSDQIIRESVSGEFKTVIDSLPTFGSHPLTEFIVLPDDSVVLNVGAPSNMCKEDMNGTSHCSERDDFGEIRLYHYNAQTDSYQESYEILARGLRNSMSLVYNEITNEIYQAENNIDTPGVPEELNTISLESSSVYDFGWPFCNGFNNLTQGLGYSFQSFCANTADRPLFLIPPHSAPLDMIYYNQGYYSQIKSGSIIMSWHGHRRSENWSLVSYETNENGEFQTPYRYTPLISGAFGERQKLRPVGVAEGPKGRIWLSDDVNAMILVLARGESEDFDSSKDETLDDKFNKWKKNVGRLAMRSFERIYSDFYEDQTCTGCHSADELPASSNKALKVMFKNRWVEAADSINESLFLKRMSLKSAKPMPPSPDRAYELKQPEIYERFKQWFLNVSS